MSVDKFGVVSVSVDGGRKLSSKSSLGRNRAEQWEGTLFATENWKAGR